ncbi:MAG TPA: 2-hydroxychromene-2-carboxylate isomerase [Polyangiaceae bacterium LLY-WYZ-15_(1-7)]|nr:disulfide bond formation protein DsbA [Myxococcales bacterium]MAT28272.1 disulfide bond formation protein DsbA [Sandaracinus sp.]HJK91694.1 2-hydroxychromene-2-carboxylate isomerase [Polyangiaceae bacterium LLY-WYZ-15_(1-7)]MBJ71145.1 disulfide bond formation protein DsbA [Sandaracinus sp.]HJL01038.1 2-hydroxychromene-2-carboxylate isomerase [Polyangiaceae bacterium LLY-WYZ-15_(1-7)]
MAGTIELYFDVVSPYSYFACTQIEALAERAGGTVDWRPFLLGGVMKATGNQPPAMLPARGRYLGKDLQRWAKRYGVPFGMPSSFPARTITAQRMLVAAREQDPASVPGLALAFFRAHWGEDRPVDDPATLNAIADEAGHDGAALLEAAGTDPIKQKLRALTDEAVERGAFGAPTMYVGDEMFFGNDRLDFVEEALRAR